ncbi:hypothetical protein EKD16_05680 [Streptomonospora litoralis]|uniref:Uncharacterized protein n=1 Tax=Streptomonospora litoralis TaxID=2498135 RepID=A0A4P6Q256_9ACTN|nr:hypothetical protein EKD16_05680 [Streptomonospora litoralis]
MFPVQVETKPLVREVHEPDYGAYDRFVVYAGTSDFPQVSGTLKQCDDNHKNYPPRVVGAARVPA